MTIQPLSSLSIGEVAAFFRDASIFTFIGVAGWHTRAAFQLVKDFFKRIMTHMDMMESFAQIVVHNHLRHIEADLKALSGRKDDLPTEP